MMADAVLLPIALWLSFALVYGELFLWPLEQYFVYFALTSLVGVCVFYKLGLYRSILLYMELQSSVMILKGVSLVTLILALIVFSFSSGAIQNSVFPIFWMVSVLFVGGGRFLTKIILQNIIHNFRPKEPIIIYGAGSSGMQLAVALLNGDQYLPVAFVDDNRSLIGNSVHGLQVYNPSSIYELIENFSVRQILLAIPSATHAKRKEILNCLEHYPVHIQTVPDLFDMVSGRVGVDEVRDIDIEDLLGRDIVPPDPQLLGACITNKSVLITGAAGSIGSELCRQIIQLQPAKVILFDSFEYGLYAIESELRDKLETVVNGDAVEIVALLGTVQNKEHMENAMETLGVDTVYHVAAYKQVPMVEKNIIEGVRNNIFGTLIAAQTAEKYAVENFVLISTDKAVRPVSVMGATKRFAEQVLQSMSARGSKTRFSMVRFGNVLGSSGSVVPLFRRQINRGGPVTVTHAEVTRYFMTVQEAAQLVIQAGSMATGGDVFVLDMNEPIRIVDLAKKMIHLMGYEIRDENAYPGDILIEYTGLRPGEKLYEELLIGASVTGTHHPKIMRAEEDFLTWRSLERLMGRLEVSCKALNSLQAREILMEAVVGFESGVGDLGPVLEVPQAVLSGGPMVASQGKVTKLFSH